MARPLRILSLFIALTLGPMMCSKMLKAHEKHGRLYNLIENALLALNRGYQSLLVRTLRMRPFVMLVALAVTAGGYFTFINLKAELAPIEDRGVLFTTGTV